MFLFESFLNYFFYVMAKLELNILHHFNMFIFNK